MMENFNTLILLALVVYVIWMGISEHRRQTASDRSLTDAQRKRFADTYAFGRPPEEYDADIRAHAVIWQRARIRKVAAVLILIAVLFIFIFMGP